jgi:hypothetical protein
VLVVAVLLAQVLDELVAMAGAEVAVATLALLVEVVVMAASSFITRR